jgi:superoxide dismutase, Cu-Zn family
MKKSLPLQAVCVLSIGKIKGYILFTETQNKDKVRVILDLKDVPKGKHGFHIHRTGDLREGCSSLCSHYNPYNNTHGGRNSTERHVGDLGNIEPDESGHVQLSFLDSHLRLRGDTSILGRSIVIHQDPDDLGLGGNEESKKTGNAGKRIACGIIGYSKDCP